MPIIKLSHLLAILTVYFSCLPFTAISNTLEISSSTKANESSNMTVTDGPYVNIESDHYLVSWLCQSKLKTIKVPFKKLPYEFKECKLKTTIGAADFTPDKVKYSGDFKIAAFSDIHGQFQLAKKLLTVNKIINKKGQWNFGNGHLVITGDIFDRGPQVTEALWFLYNLEQQAEQAGGKIHFLLGNHEVMVLNGDLRYLHPKYTYAARKFGQPFEHLFSKHTLLGRWLRSKSVVVKINDLLFTHGGIHPDLAKDKLSLKTINKTFRDNLVEKSLAKPRDGLAKYLHKTHGPIWYRGYFKADGASSKEIDIILKHFDVNHVIVGHTSMRTIETRYNSKIIAIDSSIKRGQNGELLLINGKKMWRANLQGKRTRLSTSS